MSDDAVKAAIHALADLLNNCVDGNDCATECAQYAREEAERLAPTAVAAARPHIEREVWLEAAEHVRRLAPSNHESAGACEACAYATAAASLARRPESRTRLDRGAVGRRPVPHQL